MFVAIRIRTPKEKFDPEPDKIPDPKHCKNGLILPCLRSQSHLELRFLCGAGALFDLSGSGSYSYSTVCTFTVVSNNYQRLLLSKYNVGVEAGPGICTEPEMSKMGGSGSTGILPSTPKKFLSKPLLPNQTSTSSSIAEPVFF